MATKTLTTSTDTKPDPHSSLQLGQCQFGREPFNSKVDLLRRSLTWEFGLASKISQVDASEVRQLGGTLLDRSETVFKQTKALYILAGNVRNNPTRFGCSMVALMTGAYFLWNGDLASAGIAGTLGAKELYNQCSSGDNSTLQRFLSDINADVGMVRSLEEGQQKSYKAIEENLTLISGDVNTLYDKLDQVKDLNTEGIRSLEGAKQQAHAKGLEAKEAYRDALRLFSEAKESFGASKEIYERCAQHFLTIQKLAKDEDDKTPILEKLNALVEVADAANAECAEGKKVLDDADQKFSEAMQALRNAQGLKDEAIVLITQTVQSAEDTLKAGVEKAQYTKECQHRIESTQKELQEIKERSDDVMRLLDEMSEDVKKAKAEAAKKLDPSDVVVGVGTGVALTSLGTFSAIALGITAAYAWHNGTTIVNTTKRVYNCLFGTPLPPPAPMGKNEVIRVNFQERSSGYYGAWVKVRQSFTLGSVDVNLDHDEVKQLSFDLNNRAYPVSKEDLFSFYQRMFVKLGNGTLDPAHCRAVLIRLQNVVISRGGLDSDINGLIKDRQAAYGLVKALRQLCDKLES